MNFEIWVRELHSNSNLILLLNLKFIQNDDSPVKSLRAHLAHCCRLVANLGLQFSEEQSETVRQLLPVCLFRSSVYCFSIKI